MSTSICATGANAKETSCASTSTQFKTLDAGKCAKDDDKSSAGGNLSYLNALSKKSRHHKNINCKKSGTAGFETVSDKFSTSSGSHGYKLATGTGAGSNAQPVNNSKKNSSSNSGAGNIPGLGNFMKGKFDSGSNSGNGSGSVGFGFGFGGGTQQGTNSNNNSNSTGSSGSGSFGIVSGLGSLFSGGSNNSNQTGSATGSVSGSISGSANGSITGSGSATGTSSGTAVGIGFGIGAPSSPTSGSSANNGSGSSSSSGSAMGLLPFLKPIPNSGSNNNSGNLPISGNILKPLPIKQTDLPIMSEEYINGRQLDFNEYTRRLQRWAANGQTIVSPGGTGTGGTVRPNPVIVRRPILTGGAGAGSGSGAAGGGGSGSSAGAGQGFSSNTSGLFMQQAWNAMNPKSATNDAAQQRQPDPSNPNDYYVSLPSADRTMQQVFVELVAGQDQNKKNCSGGGGCDSKGQEGNYDQLKPQEPPIEATNEGVAKALEYDEQVDAQVGDSPQAAADKAKAGGQSQCQGAGEAGAAGTVEGLEQALMVMFLPTSTVNVANEQAGTPGSTLTPFRPLSQAIWMVQKMYKQVFMPIAILLLLPGALVLNIKVMLQAGIKNGSDEDTTSPFSAIMRSMIAVFLIPATQLIVSYASDIGSSMTHEVAGATKVMALVAWAKTAMGESMTPLNGEAAGTSNMQAGKAMFAAVLNTVSMTLAYGLLMLIAFQITIMCYLMCMGPIAAAFYVWPTGVGRLFKPVFANWVDAVINIALWKFWWCVIVLCMLTRINLMTFADINPEWEAYMFVCFLVMMSYVPFCPFECKPGEMVDKILQKAQELKKSAGDQG
jgi:hypothetical protein